MTANQGPVSQTSTAGALADEVERLRARVRALEEQLARREQSARTERPSSSRQLIDLIREVSEQRERDVSALARALMLGSLEQLRLTTRVVGDFADRVDDRARTEEEDESVEEPGHRPTARRAMSRLADDVIDEALEAVRESSTIPTKVIDRVLQEYRDEVEDSPPPARRK